MNDFSLHSNLGDYISDFCLPGIHPESLYIHIKMLHTNIPINTKHASQANYGLEEMQHYSVHPESHGTLPRALSTEPSSGNLH